MDYFNASVLAGAALVFTSVLAGLLSARLGFSFLLVFLFAGILAGEDGLFGYRFDDYVLSFWVGNVALAVILLDGGLRTTYASFRTGLKPAAVLASLGVVLCAAIVAATGVVLFDLDWPTAFLLGAMIGSTDAAAVFSLLNRSGVTLNERVGATLEIESGVNDPMAVYLTLAFIAVLGAHQPGDSAVGQLASSFFKQFGWGTVLGIAGGFVMASLVLKLARRDAGGGVLALLVASGGLLVFAAAGLLGGSGFLAVYLFGLIVANRAARDIASSLPAMDGYAWLAQAGMFLLLGLLVTPSKLMGSVLPSLGIAFVLMFVARPVAVWICLKPFRFSANETWFISWVGLRGAVPIVLALFPLLAGIPQAGLLFNVAFVVVLTSLITQGSSIGWAARRLKVTIPDPENEKQVRAFYRDFVIAPDALMAEVCDFYDLPKPQHADLTVAAWLQHQIGRPPIAGDSVALGSATLVVREVQEGRIAQVRLGYGQ